MKQEMKHYKEIDYYGHTYKIGDKVYRLNHYDIEECVITDIFDDYYSDNDDYICKCVYTTRLYGSDRKYDHLEDIYLDETSARYGIQNKKDAYDRYVTRGW